MCSHFFTCIANVNSIFGDDISPLASSFMGQIFGGNKVNFTCAAEHIAKQCKQYGRQHNCYRRGDGVAFFSFENPEDYARFEAQAWARREQMGKDGS